jgi:hypothetical protein
MTEKKQSKSSLTISKREDYSEMNCVLGIDKAREKKFNEGKKIEVSKEELDKIGNPRWLLSI